MFSDQLIRFRWGIIAAFILITLFFAWQIRRLQMDTDMKKNLPDTMQSRIDTDTIDELFGGTEMLMILVQADDVLDPQILKDVRKMAKEVKRVKGVDKTLSLFDLKSVKGEDGAMIVDPAVKRIPKTAEEREALRTELENNDIVYGSVVAKDFTLTAIIAMLQDNVSDEEIVPNIQAIIDGYSGPAKLMIGGLPDIRVQVGHYIRKDMRRLMPVGIAIMLVFLYACFRRMRGVVLPFVVVIMSIIVAMGMIPVLGWKFQMITVILPVLLIAIANDYGIHMIAKYQEDNIPSNAYSREELAKRMFGSLGKPVLLTGLTTIVGMLCLLGHIIVPAKQLGILSAIGIVYALLASLFFIPAIISLLPRSKPVLGHLNGTNSKTPVIERLLGSLGTLVTRRPGRIILIALIFALLSSAGIFLVQVDTNPAGYYPKQDPVVQATDLIDQHLGGSQNISIVYQGDIKDPRLLAKIDTMEQVLSGMDEVGFTTSVARVVRQMSRALNDSNETGFDRIPTTRNGVAQYFELYSMSGDPEDFEKMVDFPYEHALVTARVNKTSTVILSEVVRRIQSMVRGDPDVMLVGGFGVMLADLAHAVVNGQILSLILATSLVAILLMILFKSPWAGVIAAIPLALSMIVLFGLMGYFGIELNIATALLSSIMIGVGIDYTIHFLWRFREEKHHGLDDREAIVKTLATTGRGIVFNAFSVIIGFSVLLISSFLPVRFFGFLVVVSILACLAGALVVIPALCLIWKPKFLR